MVVTAHWIDVNWELQKRIISFKAVTYHKGETIAEHLIQCLDEGGIGKVLTVTVDNAKGNDKALRLFTETLKAKGGLGLVKDYAYIHIRCCAHALNIIVRDGLGNVSESISALRNDVKYVGSSFARLNSFEMRVDTRKVSRGSLSLDCITRWNSTYLMLTANLKLRVASEKMLAKDKLYNDYFCEQEENGKKRVGPPTSVDWDGVKRLVKFFKIFFNSTLAFSTTKIVTFSIYYNEIMTIERHLILLSTHNDILVREDAATMRTKFEKYWDGLINMNPLVTIASIFYPRNKMQFASLCFDTLYGKDSMKSNHLKSSIKSTMKQLYEEYVSMLSKLSQCDSVGTKSDQADSDLGMLFDLSDDEDSIESLYSEMAKLSGSGGIKF